MKWIELYYKLQIIIPLIAIGFGILYVIIYSIVDKIKEKKEDK